MRDLWKIIVLVLIQMLQIEGSFIKRPKIIHITVSDGVRSKTFDWSVKNE